MSSYVKLLLSSFILISPLLGLSQNFSYLPTSKTGQVIYHEHYSLSYSEEHEQAEWTAYHLKKERLIRVFPRLNNFKIDRLIPTGSSNLSDYRKSGFDRGHLVPARDMSFSKSAMNESFYLSNISPQRKSFNRGVWRKLESLVRSWAIEYDDIYVISAGVLNTSNLTIGLNKVTVPAFFYKVILHYNDIDIKAIAFLIPNTKSAKELSKFVCSVDHIEELTGIDFFPELPDSIESVLERKSRTNQWIWN